MTTMQVLGMVELLRLKDNEAFILKVFKISHFQKFRRKRLLLIFVFKGLLPQEWVFIYLDFKLNEMT